MTRRQRQRSPPPPPPSLCLQVKAQMLPEVISTHAELFMINGDLQAMFYTASRAMHSQSINLLEGKRTRPHSSRLGAVTNAGVAVQRRFINLLQARLPPSPQRRLLMSSLRARPDGRLCWFDCCR